MAVTRVPRTRTPSARCRRQSDRAVRALGVEPAAVFPSFVDADAFLAGPPAPLPEASARASSSACSSAYKAFDTLVDAWPASRRASRKRCCTSSARDARERVAALVDELPAQTEWSRRLDAGERRRARWTHRGSSASRPARRGCRVVALEAPPAAGRSSAATAPASPTSSTKARTGCSSTPATRARSPTRSSASSGRPRGPAPPRGLRMCAPCGGASSRRSGQWARHVARRAEYAAVTASRHARRGRQAPDGLIWPTCRCCANRSSRP